MRPDGSFGFRVIDPTSGKRKGVFDYDAVRAAEQREDDAERLRLYYVAMTRAIDRLIVSGAIDLDRAQDRDTPIGWVLDRLGARDEVERAADEPVELERGDARFVLTRRPLRARGRGGRAEPRGRALPSSRSSTSCPTAPAPRGYRLPELVPPAGAAAPPRSAPLVLRACALRALLVPLLRRARRGAPRGARRRCRGGAGGLKATEIGDAVHRLLELVDLARAGRCPTSRACATWYPAVTDEELERIARVRRLLLRAPSSRRGSRRSRTSRPERPFAFEHDGVLLHGRLDVLWRDGARALVLDYKTNSLAEGTPEEIVEADYRLQRLVYALACFRAGADEVEVVYHFLERPDAVVSTTFERRGAAAARGRAVGGDRAHQRAASSSRPRASSPAPAARRSTSSAPARGSAAAAWPPPAPCRGHMP